MESWSLFFVPNCSQIYTQARCANYGIVGGIVTSDGTHYPFKTSPQVLLFSLAQGPLPKVSCQSLRTEQTCLTLQDFQALNTFPKTFGLKNKVPINNINTF